MLSTSAASMTRRSTVIASAMDTVVAARHACRAPGGRVVSRARRLAARSRAAVLYGQRPAGACRHARRARPARPAARRRSAVVPVGDRDRRSARRRGGAAADGRARASRRRRDRARIAGVRFARSTCSRRCTIRSASRCRCDAATSWCGRFASWTSSPSRITSTRSSSTIRAPLASLAPDHVVMIDSLSKRVAPGLTLGWILAPTRARAGGGRSRSARARSSLPGSHWSSACDGWWMAPSPVWSGTSAAMPSARQRLLRKACPGMTIAADPRAYHAWVELPGAWRAESFTAAAAERGIAVAPATAFAVGAGHAPNAVRLALASPPHKVLAESLRALTRSPDRRPGP